MRATDATRRVPGSGFALSLGLILWCCVGSSALAGGGPENILLIIDPSTPDSLHVGHYYKEARDIPDSNVLYMNPVNSSFSAHAAFQQQAVLGTLAQRGIADHIDYIVIAPASTYYVPASGLVSDPCSSISRFSLSSAFTMTFLADDILAGGFHHDEINRYFRQPGDWRNFTAFDSELHWSAGEPTGDTNQPRYFLGAYLGYTGNNGNTVQDLLDMIDRSVAVDGTRPAGTFYFMETTDDARSGPRDPFFDAVIFAIVFQYGGLAEHLFEVLPLGRQDCLGIMTGWASPDIDGGDFTILPGAFCDHLTSFAAHFDTSSQTKCSRWIAKGASGTHGAVQEPCNYPGKFPKPRVHGYYFNGMSLGESVLRSLQYLPYQGLIYGDPMTRPWAYLPQVTVPDAPTGPVSGVITLSPLATTSHPTAGIDHLELLVDGVHVSSAAPGGTFTVNTFQLVEGEHDLRIIAIDDTPVASQGRWVSTIEVDNSPHAATLAAVPATGDLSTGFDATIGSSGGTVLEVRLLEDGRVVAAGDSASTFSLLGNELGAGPKALQAIVDFADGSTVRSNVVMLDIAAANAPTGDPGPNPPVAYSYTQRVPLNEPIMLELPASDPDGSSLSLGLLTSPAQAGIDGSGPVRLLRPNSDAAGCDSFTFRASDGNAVSNTAMVSLRYEAALHDADLDGDRDLADVLALQACFTGADPASPPSSACATAFDQDCDNDVDEVDYRYFARFLQGPAGN